MIANYGYKDGSGEYFIAVDTDVCDGCGACADACPHGVMGVGPDENDPLSDLTVAFVTEAERKKIKYTCAPCKPMAGRPPLPCVAACPRDALAHSW